MIHQSRGVVSGHRQVDHPDVVRACAPIHRSPRMMASSPIRPSQSRTWISTTFDSGACRDRRHDCSGRPLRQPHSSSSSAIGPGARCPTPAIAAERSPRGGVPLPAAWSHPPSNESGSTVRSGPGGDRTRRREARSRRLCPRNGDQPAGAAASGLGQPPAEDPSATIAGSSLAGHPLRAPAPSRAVRPAHRPDRPHRASAIPGVLPRSGRRLQRGSRPPNSAGSGEAAPSRVGTRL